MKTDELIEEEEQALDEKFKETISFTESPVFAKNEIRARVNKDKILEVCRFLKHEKFDYLMTITAADYPEQNQIEIVYLLGSTESEHSGIKIMLKASLDRKKPEIESVSSLWKGADFMEREVFDLFGVIFKNHPDLRRIFLEEDFKGHPLRKDYSDKLMLKLPVT